MLISKFIKATSLILILSISLVGCSSKNKINEPTKKIISEVNSTMNKTNEVYLKKFNLGKSTFQERGNTIPFDKEGIIAVPKEITQKVPVVFVFHGRHSAEDNTNFEDGFKYLVEYLAKNGIIALSIDTSVNYTFSYGEPVENERIPYIFQEHINSLILANQGENIGYGIDLKNKIDLENIGLIGHSVAGMGVYNIAKDQQDKGNDSINGILSIAPAYNTLMDDFVDIPSAIIVSEYDGDVIHSGADLYEDILKNNQNRKSPIGLSYLIGGNHNAFNSALGYKEFSAPQTTFGTYPDKITGDQQRDFISNYAVDFMKSITNIDKSVNPVFIKNNVTPIRLYGYEVLSKVYYNNSNILFSDIDFDDVSLNNVNIKEVVESYIPDKDSFEVFTTIENAEELNLLIVDWNSDNATIEIPLNENNLSNYSQIGLRWALNSPSKLNSFYKDVSFDISLVDAKGKEARVNISNNNISALKYFYGELIISEYVEGMFHNYWSRSIPISDTNIPIKSFSNIDLSNIKSLKIYFNNTESGSLVLDKVIGIK